MISTQDIVVRLLLALLFSGVVGLQRTLTGKTAGLRTHILVGVGAALYTLISGYAFKTTASNADRIAAQIVSGIGFIGGGAILKERGAIKGLTTAAGLWAAAALGMAAGAGLYTMGAAASIMILITLAVLQRVEQFVPRPHRRVEVWSLDVTLDASTPVADMRHAITPHCRRIGLVAFVRDEEVHLTFSAEVPHPADLAAITEQLRAAGARAIAWHAAGDIDLEEGP